MPGLDVKSITMMQAAMRARLPYKGMLDRVLTHRVKGWQDEDRRWHVDAADLDRFIAERDAAARVAAA